MGGRYLLQFKVLGDWHHKPLLNSWVPVSDLDLQDTGVDPHPHVSWWLQCGPPLCLERLALDTWQVQIYSEPWRDPCQPPGVQKLPHQCHKGGWWDRKFETNHEEDLFTRCSQVHLAQEVREIKIGLSSQDDWDQTSPVGRTHSSIINWVTNWDFIAEEAQPQTDNSTFEWAIHLVAGSLSTGRVQTWPDY